MKMQHQCFGNSPVALRYLRWDIRRNLCVHSIGPKGHNGEIDWYLAIDGI